MFNSATFTMGKKSGTDKFQMFEVLVNQLKVFAYTETGSFVRYDAPKGQHDDGVAALSMAVWGKVSGWAGKDDRSVSAMFLY